MTDEVIYEEEVGQDLAVRDQAPVTLFGTDDPIDVIERASAVATALSDVIDKKHLFANISGKKHLTVEAWTLLGSMLGVFPETEWTRRTVDSKGQEAYEARVVARTRDGSVVGAREAMCSRSEARWAKADDYALRSMAQTRAVSGALAAPLRFVVVLAGYEGTPEAEMPHGGVQPAAAPSPESPADVVIHFGKNKDKGIRVKGGFEPEVLVGDWPKAVFPKVPRARLSTWLARPYASCPAQVALAVPANSNSRAIRD